MARDQRARRIDHRTRSLLRYGPRLHRLRAFGSTERSRQFLCDSRQVQSQGPAPLLPQSRQNHRSDLRPNGCAHCLLLAPRFRRTPEESQIQRSPDWKESGLLTNNFALPALTITQLYRCRWQIKLFFKWIKQHLRIKAFFGTTENAVKTQIWIAVSVYVLIAIVKKRLNLQASLYELLQLLSLTMFERTPLQDLLTVSAPPNPSSLITQ